MRCVAPNVLCEYTASKAVRPYERKAYSLVRALRISFLSSFCPLFLLSLQKISGPLRGNAGEIGCAIGRQARINCLRIMRSQFAPAIPGEKNTPYSPKIRDFGPRKTINRENLSDLSLKLEIYCRKRRYFVDYTSTKISGISQKSGRFSRK